MRSFLAITILLFLGAGQAAAQDAATTQAPIKNLKVLDERPDGKGNVVRTVQWTQGLMKVTQTTIVPIDRVPGYVAPIRLDTLNPVYLTVAVIKSKYKLDVYYRNRVIRSYKAVFGPRPLEDKCMEGDRCTPEGIYKIANKNPGSKYTKFMGISYPNDSSTKRFNKLKAEGKIPQSATIGGNVGIHGIWPGGDDMIELGVGWTDGCIALKNKDIEELFSYIGVGTKVVIRK